MPAGFDPLSIAMFAILGVLIFFMFRNSRKRKAQVEDLKSKIVPGAEVMTNFGLFGTLISIDEVASTAELEITPGTIVKVHSQTIAKVVTAGDATDSDEPRSVEEAMERANREEAEREALNASEPEFGERVSTVDTDASDAVVAEEPVKKPAARRTTKKVDE